jgi:hypothetical protein
VGSSYKTEGKSTVSSRGFSERKESMSGGLELQLTSDERWWKRSREASAWGKMEEQRRIFAAWGHGRSVRPPAASQLGGDRVAHWVAREACTGWLTCGDLGQFK